LYFKKSNTNPTEEFIGVRPSVAESEVDMKDHHKTQGGREDIWLSMQTQWGI
jgi:hypothetical protein